MNKKKFKTTVIDRFQNTDAGYGNLTEREKLLLSIAARVYGETQSRNVLLQASKNALADLEGIMPVHDPDGDRTHPAWETMKELELAINNTPK